MTQLDTDWRETYRTLTPEEQEQTQDTPAPKLPGPKSNNSFSKLVTFSNDCHDENGRFCEGEGEGEGDSSNTKSFSGGVHEFPSDNQVRSDPRATAWWTKDSAQFRGNLSGDERNSLIEDYAYSDFNHSINALARGKDTDPWDNPWDERDKSRASTDIQHIDNALTKAPGFTDPVLTYRGIRLPDEYTQEQANDWVQKNYTPGSTVDLARGGYQSTSIRPTTAVDVSGTVGVKGNHEGIVFEVLGHSGAPLGNHPIDAEILYGRNIKFTVKSVQPNTSFKYGRHTEKRTVIQVEEKK